MTPTPIEPSQLVGSVADPSSNLSKEQRAQRGRNVTNIDRSSALRGVAATLMLALAACGGSAEAGDTAEANEAAAEEFTRIINVETSPIESAPFSEVIRLTGTVAANRDVVLAAEESGRITSVFLDKGRRVRAGTAIAKIADDGLVAQVEQARAVANLADETWTRRKRLYEEDQVGSELAYLEAKYSAEQAAAAVAALEDRLAKTVIRAPFSGVLEDRMIEVGSMVAPGTSVARVIDLDPVEIQAGVPERYALDVAQGASVSVSFDVIPGEVFEGTVSFVGSAVDAQSRTFPVEFAIPNRDETIKPEMVANVSLVRRERSEAIVVPQEALVRVEDGYVVFVVEGTGDQATARVRRIERGPSQNNRVVVESGLAAGEDLIVVGQHQVEDGDRVRLVGNG